MILSSASFEGAHSNIYYLDKIRSDQKMIEKLNLKVALESDRPLFSREDRAEDKKAGLKSPLSQESQLNDISARRADAANVVANLDDNVKELIACVILNFLLLSRRQSVLLLQRCCCIKRQR